MNKDAIFELIDDGPYLTINGLNRIQKELKAGKKFDETLSLIKKVKQA